MPGVIAPRLSAVCTTQLKEARVASPLIPRLFLSTSVHHFRCQEDSRVVARHVQAKCHVEETNSPPVKPALRGSLLRAVTVWAHHVPGWRGFGGSTIS